MRLRYAERPVTEVVALMVERHRAGRAMTTLDLLLIRDQGLCTLCGGPVAWTKDSANPLRASRDHRTPRASGGSHDLANLRLSHAQCNSDRSAGTADGWGTEVLSASCESP